MCSMQVRGGIFECAVAMAVSLCGFLPSDRELQLLKGSEYVLGNVIHCKCGLFTDR